MSPALAVVVGLVVLLLGADLLVRGAVRVGRAIGLSPVVVGMTVVAFGTSAPELAASLAAAFDGAPGVVLGTVVGSNFANLGLVLGLAAMVRPVTVPPAFLRHQAPWLVGSALALVLVSLDGSVQRWEGLFMLAPVPFFINGLRHEAREELDGSVGRRGPGVLMALGGLVALAWGADTMVGGAMTLATRYGVSETTVGLSLVAIGTSLPELATTLVAAARKQHGLILGNVVGSNVLNVFVILGLVALVHPLTLDLGGVQIALWGLLALSAGVIPLLWSGRRFGRIEGALVFAAWVTMLVLNR